MRCACCWAALVSRWCELMCYPWPATVSPDTRLVRHSTPQSLPHIEADYTSVEAARARAAGGWRVGMHTKAPQPQQQLAYLCVVPSACRRLPRSYTLHSVAAATQVLDERRVARAHRARDRAARCCSLPRLPRRCRFRLCICAPTHTCVCLPWACGDCRYTAEQQLQQATGAWVLRGPESMAAQRAEDMGEHREDAELMRASASYVWGWQCVAWRDCLVVGRHTSCCVPVPATLSPSRMSHVATRHPTPQSRRFQDSRDQRRGAKPR